MSTKVWLLQLGKCIYSGSGVEEHRADSRIDAIRHRAVQGASGWHRRLGRGGYATTWLAGHGSSNSLQSPNKRPGFPRGNPGQPCVMHGGFRQTRPFESAGLQGWLRMFAASGFPSEDCTHANGDLPSTGPFASSDAPADVDQALTLPDETRKQRQGQQSFPRGNSKRGRAQAWRFGLPFRRSGVLSPGRHRLRTTGRQVFSDALCRRRYGGEADALPDRHGIEGSRLRARNWRSEREPPYLDGQSR